METANEEKTYTIEDIFALPDGERAELIDGKIYPMPMTTTTHQRTLGKLFREIYSYIIDNNKIGEALTSPFAVVINNDESNLVVPDISVTCDLTKFDERACNGAPDWIVEIVMQESRVMDYFIKPTKYWKAGVREYWIVDPADKLVTVYGYVNGCDGKVEITHYKLGEEVPVGIYSGFSIKIPDNLQIT